MHAWLVQHADDGPETRMLPDRCLVFSQSGPPFLPGNYNNYYQIVQTPGVVAILSEMGHQVRTIPLTNGTVTRPHLPREREAMGKVIRWATGKAKRW